MSEVLGSRLRRISTNAGVVRHAAPAELHAALLRLGSSARRATTRRLARALAGPLENALREQPRTERITTTLHRVNGLGRA